MKTSSSPPLSQTQKNMKMTQDFKKKSPVDPYKEIAEGMEANFTSHLIKEMRKTVPKEKRESSSMEYYNSLLDYERSQMMAKSDSGLGVKKVILDQIVPQHLKHYLQNNPNSQKTIRPQMTKESKYE